MKAAVRLLAFVMLAVGLTTGAQAAWIPAKALVAQVLLEDAWRRARQGEAEPVPWPWADAWPVARLVAPDHDQHLVVLSDASGRALAFGPGHLVGTPAPGQPGTSIIAGHRDTHFAFLRDVRVGDRIELETREGASRIYTVAATSVVHERDARVAIDVGRDRLILVTCWPFDALRPGTDQRFVVHADLEEGRVSADG